MTSEMTTSWAMLMALGAFHGINPGMGWLFAVALGMQERRRGAVSGRSCHCVPGMRWPWPARSPPRWPSEL
jgi:threonine/homoserine/homoserine lactone efflux protein